MLAAFFLIPFLTIAHVIQDDVSVTERTPFSFDTVCRKMAQESPLIEAVSGTILDCMGTKVEVGPFCDKAMAQDPYYLRAWIDKEKKQVICQSGKKVIFRYLCVKLADKHLCQRDAQKSCAYMREKLAKRLDIVHAALLKNEKGIPQLNCFFESTPLKETLDDKL